MYYDDDDGVDVFCIMYYADDDGGDVLCIVYYDNDNGDVLRIMYCVL